MLFVVFRHRLTLRAFWNLNGSSVRTSVLNNQNVPENGLTENLWQKTKMSKNHFESPLESLKNMQPRQFYRVTSLLGRKKKEKKRKDGIK